MLCSGLKLGRHVPPLGEGQSNLLCGRHHHECCLNTINHGDLPAKFWFIWWDEHPFTSSFDVTQGTGFWPTPISIQQSRDTPNLLFKCEKKTNFLFFAGYGLELGHTHCKNLSVYVYCFPKEVPQHPTPASVSHICRHPVLSFVCLTDICHDQKLDSISKLINPSGVLYIYMCPSCSDSHYATDDHEPCFDPGT